MTRDDARRGTTGKRMLLFLLLLFYIQKISSLSVYYVDYIKASNSAPFMLFGSDIDAHGSRLIVGAYAESTNATGVNYSGALGSMAYAGAAYIFSFTVSSGWQMEAFLKPNVVNYDDRFGKAVAIGDRTAVVCSPGSESAEGACFTFSRDESYPVASWTPGAYLKASNPRSSAFFGASVATHGDTIVVSSPFEASCSSGVGGSQTEIGCVGYGAVYVFERVGRGENWYQNSYIKAEKPSSTVFRFGFSVDIYEDIIAVGTVHDTNAGQGVGGYSDFVAKPSAMRGSVHLYRRVIARWEFDEIVYAPDSFRDAQFGFSVALFVPNGADDYRLAVGAPAHDSCGVLAWGDGVCDFRGSVYVFERHEGEWLEASIIRAPGAPDFRPRFGQSVSMHKGFIAIGATREGTSSPGVDPPGGFNELKMASGATFMAERTPPVSGVGVGSWDVTNFIKAMDVDANDACGYTTAIMDHYIAFACPYENGVPGDYFDNTAVASGAVYMYSYFDFF